jgi:hypothetical protein
MLRRLLIVAAVVAVVGVAGCRLPETQPDADDCWDWHGENCGPDGYCGSDSCRLWCASDGHCAGEDFDDGDRCAPDGYCGPSFHGECVDGFCEYQPAIAPAPDAGQDAGTRDAGHDAGLRMCPETLALWTYSSECEVAADCMFVSDDPCCPDCALRAVAASERQRYEGGLACDCMGELNNCNCVATPPTLTCFDGVCGTAGHGTRGGACREVPALPPCDQGLVCNGGYCEEGPAADGGPDAGALDSGTLDAGALDAGDAG